MTPNGACDICAVQGSSFVGRPLQQRLTRTNSRVAPVPRRCVSFHRQQLQSHAHATEHAHAFETRKRAEEMQRRERSGAAAGNASSSSALFETQLVLPPFPKDAQHTASIVLAAAGRVGSAFSFATHPTPSACR